MKTPHFHWLCAKENHHKVRMYADFCINAMATTTRKLNPAITKTTEMRGSGWKAILWFYLLLFSVILNFTEGQHDTEHVKLTISDSPLDLVTHCST